MLDELLKVGMVLKDRDNRRKGREVKVISVDNDTVTVKTVRSIGGAEVEDGTESVVSKSRIFKAYTPKFNKGGITKGGTIRGEDVLPDSFPVDVTINKENTLPDVDLGKASVEGLKNQIIREIMALAEPGNEIVLNRISALESRVNSIEYGGGNYWKPNVYCDTTNMEVPEQGNQHEFRTMTGSVVSNYPSIEEVLEKVLPETETEDFDYLWDRLTSENRNPHETVVRLVYNLLTK